MYVCPVRITLLMRQLMTTLFNFTYYYPYLVIPVGNTEHQMIDNLSTGLLSYGIQSLETIGFTLKRMNYLIVLYKRHNNRLLVMTCCCKLHDLAMF